MSPLRVLLAEDNADLRDLLAATLAADGYEVVEAATGSELAAVIAASATGRGGVPAPALVITDNRMPGKSGLEVIAGMREINPTTPVILITGYGDAVVRDQARRLGVSVILDKPFELDDLRAAVRALAKPP
jgi:CheY-like chemotaxis protein